MYKSIAIVPARSGSKRLPNKNILKLGNKTLIQNAIDFAKNLNCNKVIFSSDSTSYFESIQDNKEIIFHKRNTFSSIDKATDYDVIYDIYKSELLKDHEIIIWIRPTTPIRDYKECQKAIVEFNNVKDFNSMRSIKETKEHPYWMKTFKENRLNAFLEEKDEKKFPNSQSLPTLYYPSCEFEISKIHAILSQKSLICNPTTGYITKTETVDIDTINDYRYAKFLTS